MTDLTTPIKKQEVILLLLVAFCVLLTRLPFLGEDYGRYPDSYRVVNVAREIAQTGEYKASRFPGNPVHEFTTSLVIHGGHIASNSLTAVFSVMAFVFFALILRHFDVRDYLLISTTFALTPVIYINSTCTIDYIWALASILASTYFILRGNPFVGGLLLGLAIGCRITSGAMIVPLSFYIYLSRDESRNKKIFVFMLSSLVVGTLCFIPTFRKYGLDFFTFYEYGYPSIKSVFVAATFVVWGQIGTILLALLICSIPMFLKHIKTAFSRERSRNALFFSCLTFFLYLIAYLRLPHQTGYLVPLIPFVFLSISLVTPRPLLILFCVFMLSTSFIKIDINGVSLYGPIRQDYLRRQSDLQKTQSLISEVGSLSNKSVIVAGWSLPRIRSLLGSDSQECHRYVYLIPSKNQYKRYQKQGYDILFLPDIDRLNWRVYSIDLRAYGARQLNTFP